MDDRTLHNELVRLQRNLSQSMADYVHATRRMIYMVKAVDLTLESLYSGRALERAIWRYEALWLPILAALSNAPSGTFKPPKQPTFSQSSFSTKVDDIRSKNFSKGGLWLNPNNIVAPIDIAWVWHCHRINPIAYTDDLKQFAKDGDVTSHEYLIKACSTSVDTAFRFSDGEDMQSKGIKRLWKIIYPFESYMPKYLISHSFDIEENKKRQHITSYTNEIIKSSFRSIIQYDLREACHIQKSFLYQIIDETNFEKGELYETNKYLQRAYHRYLQFIILHQHEPDTLLIPMNDINIIWHMHLSCTTEYQHDCLSLIEQLVKHDPIHVEKVRIENMHSENSEERGEDHIDPSIIEKQEFKKLYDKKLKGIAIRETKEVWEGFYGSNPRYDLPDTTYRGQPTGDRGGFYQVFQKTNGTAKDITWTETLLRMVLAILVFLSGLFSLFWFFYNTMMKHGKFLLGLPVAVAIMAFGIYIFFSIPTSRPLSSQSRLWLERAYRQTHNPLPPYLISTDKKVI